MKMEISHFFNPSATARMNSIAGGNGGTGAWSGPIRPRWRPGQVVRIGFRMVVFLCLGNPVDPTRAAEWSQFRGSNGSGVMETSQLPVQFGPHQNLVWRVPTALGHSSPILTRDRIFLSAIRDERLWVICLERASGKTLWEREVPRSRSQIMHRANSPASPTPVTDGTNVYAFFNDFGLISFGPNGQERWHLPLGPFNNPMGLAASPILADGRILMICDQESGSFFVAVDQDTGRVLWRVERPGYTRGFATPVLYRPKGGDLQVIVSGSHQLTAYSVETGQEIWWIRGLTWQMKSTPVMDGEKLYLNGWAGGSDEGQREVVAAFSDVLAERDADGDRRLSRQEMVGVRLKWEFGKVDLDRTGFLENRDWRVYRARRSARNGALGIRLGGQGDMTESNLFWRYRKSLPNVPSPLLYKDILYLMKEGGILTALNPATGTVLKQGRLMDALGTYYASPVAGDDKIFAVSHEGKVSVIRAGADWQVLSVNDLGSECSATPALSAGRLYIRTRDTLFCFGRQHHPERPLNAKKGRKQL